MSRKAFTITELLVALSLIALLIALLLPALAGARRAARNVKCLSNLAQIARGAHAYMATQPFVRPADPGLLDLAEAVWVCPEFVPMIAPNDVSYIWVSIPPPGRTSILAWSNATQAGNGGHESIAYDASPLFHGHTNCAFLDGHAARDPDR